MKHLNCSVKCLALASTIIISSALFANDIYIQQVGDTLDLDIVQDGQDNKIGTGTQDVVLGSTGNDADNMTFSITQTGNSNTITAQILGATYTGTWTFTGDNNEVDLLCSSSAAGNCDNVTLNIAATGDDQDYTINIPIRSMHRTPWHYMGYVRIGRDAQVAQGF